MNAASAPGQIKSPDSHEELQEGQGVLEREVHDLRILPTRRFSGTRALSYPTPGVSNAATLPSPPGLLSLRLSRLQHILDRLLA